jgi:hypothetical protein
MLPPGQDVRVINLVDADPGERSSSPRDEAIRLCTQCLDVGRSTHCGLPVAPAAAGVGIALKQFRETVSPCVRRVEI